MLPLAPTGQKADASGGHVIHWRDERPVDDIPAFGEAGQVPDHDAVRELFVGMFSVFPDFHIVSGPLQHGDDHVVVEVRLSGTQHADWAGIPSTGRSFDPRVAAIYDSRVRSSCARGSTSTSVKSPASSRVPDHSAGTTQPMRIHTGAAVA